jgi:hypothetical protein
MDSAAIQLEVAMSPVRAGRFSHQHDDGIAVFLIGMRVNRWHRPDVWGPTLAAMGPMLAELYGDLDSGFLGHVRRHAGRRARGVGDAREGGGGMTVTLDPESIRVAGILLVAVATIAYGGTFMLRVVGGKVPATPFQQAFFRAGHAHAGVLVILALVSLLYLDAARLDGAWYWIGGRGVAAAAILMPAGFFFAAIGRGRDRPNRWIVLLWLGAASLVAGVVTLGVGLLLA